MAEAEKFQLSERFNNALAFAYQLHHTQERKESGIPYLGHILAVAALVIEDGGSEDEAIATLLHDGPEDQGGRETLKRIRCLFGDDVAEIVDHCSDTFEDPKPPWLPRKRKYLAGLEDASPSVLRVSLADKVANARTILTDYRSLGEPVWKRFNDVTDQLWYYSALRDVFTRRFPGALADELSRVVAEIETLAAAWEPPFPDAYWALRGRVLAGEYPFALDKTAGITKLDKLLSTGVTLIIDLTDDHDRLEPYAGHLPAGVRHGRIEIVDLSVPTHEDMRRILDLIRDELRRKGTVYIHCWGGVGRTAVVVGCLLREIGWTGDEALAWINQLRAGTPKAVRPAPEKPAQVGFVQAWPARSSSS